MNFPLDYYSFLCNIHEHSIFLFQSGTKNDILIASGQQTDREMLL